MDIELITVLENVIIAFLIILSCGFIHKVFVMAGIPQKICTLLSFNKNKELRTFGDVIVGTWYCPSCEYHIFPNKLKKLEDSFTWSNKNNELIKPAIGPHCKKCNIPMNYDEAE